MSTDTIAVVLEWKVKDFNYLMENNENGLYCVVGRNKKILGNGKRIPLAIGYGNPIGNTISNNPKVVRAQQMDKSSEIWCGEIKSAMPASMRKGEVETILKKTMNYTLSPPFNDAIKHPPSQSVFITNQWNSRNGYWFEPPCERWPDLIDCRREVDSYLIWSKTKKVSSGKLSKA